jgi:hypothetical protein
MIRIVSLLFRMLEHGIEAMDSRVSAPFMVSMRLALHEDQCYAAYLKALFADFLHESIIRLATGPRFKNQ